MINITIDSNIINDVYFPYFLDYKHRYEIYYGGSGSGKSVFVAQKLLYKSLSECRKILVIRKYGTTLKDSVFDLFVSMLKKWKIFNYCKINLSSYYIQLPNDSLIIFKGMDDSEKIKSITDITDIWIEEATELSNDEYTQLDLRLRAMKSNLQLICSFNPVSKANWVYKKWFKNPITDKNILVLRTTYKDNKFLPDEYINALVEKQKSNPTYYKIYTLGEFCSLDKLVFNNWTIKEFDYKELAGTLSIGMDFGFSSDLSTIVASIIDNTEKKIYIFSEWGETGYTNDKLANVITNMGFNKSIIIADAAEPKSIEEIKRNGITHIRACSKGADSILHGIQKLQQYEIIVHPSCTGIITELENYSWKKKDDEYINTPIDKFNHYIDALRYSIQAIDSSRKVKVFDKNLLI